MKLRGIKSWILRPGPTLNEAPRRTSMRRLTRPQPLPCLATRHHVNQRSTAYHYIHVRITYTPLHIQIKCIHHHQLRHQLPTLYSSADSCRGSVSIDGDVVTMPSPSSSLLVRVRLGSMPSGLSGFIVTGQQQTDTGTDTLCQTLTKRDNPNLDQLARTCPQPIYLRSHATSFPHQGD